jgi:hypothetical protein
MVSSDERVPEIVVLCRSGFRVEPLRRELERHGLRFDVARSLEELRSAFFRRGGHDLLLLTPDLSPNFAERAADAVHDLDPNVAVVAFGRELGRATFRGIVTRLPEFHPASRAGVGAVLRVLSVRRGCGGE